MSPATYGIEDQCAALTTQCQTTTGLIYQTYEILGSKDSHQLSSDQGYAAGRELALRLVASLERSEGMMNTVAATCRMQNIDSCCTAAFVICGQMDQRFTGLAQATQALENRRTAQTPYPYQVPRSWGGGSSSYGSSGHEAGYQWAEERGIDDPGDCGGNSQSFIEGCEEYAEEQQAEQEEESEEDE